MSNEELKSLLNQQVRVVNRLNKGTYVGKVAGFRPGKFVLVDMLILNPDGSVKVASKSKASRTRWFETAGCSVERFDWPEQTQAAA